MWSLVFTDGSPPDVSPSSHLGREEYMNISCIQIPLNILNNPLNILLIRLDEVHHLDARDARAIAIESEVEGYAATAETRDG